MNSGDEQDVVDGNFSLLVVRGHSFRKTSKTGGSENVQFLKLLLFSDNKYKKRFQMYCTLFFRCNKITFDENT